MGVLSTYIILSICNIINGDLKYKINKTKLDII